MPTPTRAPRVRDPHPSSPPSSPPFSRFLPCAALLAALLLLLAATAATAQDDASSSGRSAGAAPPDGVARIHYGRPDGAYDGFELHVWEDTTEEVSWADGLDPTGRDDFGVYWDVDLADDAERVGFIVHRGDEKDPGPDLFLELARHGREVWLQSGSTDILSSPPLPPPAANIARLHYHRPDGAYDGFELHVWEDTTEQVSWADGLDPDGATDFGVYWEVDLVENAERLGFIVHRGDDKDPGPDMFLDLAEAGPEAWIVSGSPTVHPERPDIRVAGSGDLSLARAHWVLADTLAWDAGELLPGSTFELHASPDAGLALSAEGVTGGESIALEVDPAGLPPAVTTRFPHLRGYTALRLAPEDAARAGGLLRGQTAVSLSAGGRLLDATGLQIPGVLDDLYANDEPLGVHWRDGAPRLALWAPTAQRVRLHRFEGSHGADAEVLDEVVDMDRDPDTGVWTVQGAPHWIGDAYAYEVTVYAPATGRIETNLVTDPYSVALTRNSRRSLLVDLDDPALKPAGWEALAKPPLAKFEDIAIYEIHLRDFSVGDDGVPAEHQGTYRAFGHPDSHGMRHLRALREAGLTHLHLLPTFDIATIDEDPAARREPAIPPLTPPSASPEPQEAVEAVRDRDAYNWGYDPWHYNVPEGSYATDADGPQRILEFREMVQNLNQLGLRVVVDVVYNHTHAAGQAERSVLDRIVPGYYHRLDPRGFVITSTCCPNTASEHAMMEKLMVDSVLLWATAYRVDGFRFDLMGHHMRRNMRTLRAALDGLERASDGVDGERVYLYGEGWDFGEVAGGARGPNATQWNMAGLGIGTFSDRLRDAVRGGGCCPSGEALYEQGFGNGLHWLPNAHQQARRSRDPALAQAQRDDLLRRADLVRLGLAGNLRDFEFENRHGAWVRGADLDYHGNPAGYALDPQETVTYVSAHDNHTLFDRNALAAPRDLSMTERVRLQQLGLSLVSLAQGVRFYAAGSDTLRSKSLDRNSYNSGDHFNALDFGYESNTFGVGLPTAADNRTDWARLRPLLDDPALLPSADEIAHSASWFREWLAIRDASELFRLPTADEIAARLAFHNTGPEQVPGVIVMSLSDRVPGLPDLDPRAEQLWVVVNATPRRHTLTLPELAGRDLRLHPVQAQGVDARVKTAAMYSHSGQVSVPALTTAVFVEFDTPLPRADR